MVNIIIRGRIIRVNCIISCYRKNSEFSTNFDIDNRIIENAWKNFNKQKFFKGYRKNVCSYLDILIFRKLQSEFNEENGRMSLVQHFGTATSTTKIVWRIFQSNKIFLSLQNTILMFQIMWNRVHLTQNCNILKIASFKYWDILSPSIFLTCPAEFHQQKNYSGKSPLWTQNDEGEFFLLDEWWLLHLH